MLRKKKIFDNFFKLISKIELQYPKNPFGTRPLASNQKYLELFNEIKDEKYPAIDNFEKECSFKIDKEWLDQLALITQITIKKSKLNYQHGRILYSKLREYLNENDFKDETINIIETGTSKGFSSICLSKALNDSNQKGKIITFDLLPHNKKMIWNSIIDQDNLKSRNELLQNWQEEIKNIIFIQGFSTVFLKRVHIDRCHFAFLDAEHTLAEVMNEFNYIKNKQKSGDIIIFDDVTPNQFDGVVQAIKEIEKQNLYVFNIIMSSDKRGYAIAKKK